MGLREFPHYRRDLIVHVRQTTLFSRTVIIDRALRGPAIRIQNVPPPSDMPVLRVRVSREDLYNVLITVDPRISKIVKK